MRYLKTYEKYVHTQQDKNDDINLINDFANKFEDLFEFRLNLERYHEPKFRGYLGYGADVHYDGQVELDNPNILKRKVNIKYRIFLETDINPNGISGANDIGRTFTISFEKRKNRSRNVNNIKDFYGYSRNMEDIMENFNNYLVNTLYIEDMSDEEKVRLRKEKEFNKQIKKYNL